jgi:tyrosine-protein kinase Etk/Wzc
MGLSDPTLVQLLTRLYDTESQYAKLQKVTGEKSDVQEQLREELSRLRPAIQENIRNIRTNLVATKSNLLGQVAQTSQLLKEVPHKERALVEISRQQAIKNSIYTFLLQKREETALSYSSAVTDSRLVEGGRATSNPVKPVRALIWIIGLTYRFWICH